MPTTSQNRPVRQVQGPGRIRTVRVHVASPVDKHIVSHVHKSTGLQKYFKDAVKSVCQTDRSYDLTWRNTDFRGKIEHDEHHQRHGTGTPAQRPARRNLLVLPAPAEMTVTFKRYVVEMLEKVANSKDVGAKEPNWKFNEFKGRIEHRHNGDHHSH